MTDYKEKFDRWQKKATEKFEEIDAQLGLKDKIEGGAKAVYDAAKTGPSTSRPRPKNPT